MPPRKGIVKSGNAGNSSKTSKSNQDVSSGAEEKPLFPPGSKYPLNLLHERCQKNGWEKPTVDTRRHGDGHSFCVTLARINKKTSEQETVRLEPHPPYILPTSLEARHWGATYALYRFCNGIQLNRVLPPAPREYWNQLAAEHKIAPEHQKWMYDADPFAARKMVDERQAKATQRRETSTAEAGSSKDTSNRSGVSPGFANAAEVKMASSLREFVEASIKEAFASHPELKGEAEPSVLKREDVAGVQQQLSKLGFKPAQCQSATAALSQPSPLSSSLLSAMPPLQACIEYLVLHVPECDLPTRFLPDINASNSFISSAHSGSENIKTRWLEERAAKEGGWPTLVVRECMAKMPTPDDWAALIRMLNSRLLGEKYEEALALPDPDTNNPEILDEAQLELEGWDFRFVNEAHLVLTLPVAPIDLNVILGLGKVAGTHTSPPPLYIASSSVPGYIRLHLLSTLLLTLKGRDSELGESLLMTFVSILEEEWARIETEGPPDIAMVMQHLLPRAAPINDTRLVNPDKPDLTPDPRTKRRATVHRKVDNRTDEQIKKELLSLRDHPKCRRILEARKKLPASAAEPQFLDILTKNRCVVVVGETGCGKTTQLPQFILDSLILAGHGLSASIVVTQPRRLSAIGVSARVSTERMDDGSVGYAIRGENKQDERTKLLFCTTGVVLRRLVGGDGLKDVTHIVVDEVHERSVDGDILLLQLKELMKTHKKLKVILMSATINHEIFVKYFNNAPLLTIPGFTHPVQDLYLESFIKLLSYKPTATKGLKKMTEEEKHQLHKEYSAQGLDDESVRAIQTLSRSNRVDYELIAATVNHIVATADKPAGILIFLPGVQEIRQCIEALRDIPNSKAFPLHANLSSDEQRLVFAPISQWKIVAATNVAETSITIDDVVYVIDSGKVKETQYDPESGVTKLVELWVTRAAAKQRRGRAGRTRPGVCYKLYTKKQEEEMSPFPIPEIKRVPLESVSLSVKVMQQDPKAFLSMALEPPDITALDNSLATLEELGAISSDGQITPLGQHLASLPLDLRLGKMLILGTIFRCFDPVLTVAACVSSKPLFLNPIDNREEASRARERFAVDNSDLLTDANAYDECLRRRAEGASQSAIRTFCDENFISASTLRDITSLRGDLFASLSSINLVPYGCTPTSTTLNTNSTNTNLVKACVLGGLWPRVARVSLPPGAVRFDRVQAGTIQRENAAKDYKFYDVKAPGERVFLHPASVLFATTAWKSPFVTYFQKQMTSKVFLRDATEVPTYALLLFGGPVTVNHVAGGLTVGSKDSMVKLRAWPRIGVLVNQLRRLLDAQLARSVEEGTSLADGGNVHVLEAILALLTRDGLSG